MAEAYNHVHVGAQTIGQTQANSFNALQVATPLTTLHEKCVEPHGMVRIKQECVNVCVLLSACMHRRLPVYRVPVL